MAGTARDRQPRFGDTGDVDGDSADDISMSDADEPQTGASKQRAKLDDFSGRYRYGNTEAGEDASQIYDLDGKAISSSARRLVFRQFAQVRKRVGQAIADARGLGLPWNAALIIISDRAFRGKEGRLGKLGPAAEIKIGHNDGRLDSICGDLCKSMVAQSLLEEAASSARQRAAKLVRCLLCIWQRADWHFVLYRPLVLQRCSR